MESGSKVNRRDFLRAGIANGASLAALSGISILPQKAWGANDRVRMAVVGVRGRGGDHIQGFGKVPDAEVAAICDVDDAVISKRLEDMSAWNLPKPKVYKDIRKLLEDKSIDAISVATPNHWHSLMGIWACQAGKDAYVEKPCSHSWWEGHQLVAATRKYNRIVMHGTQGRSAEGYIEGVRKLREGVIGDVYLSRGLCFKWRDTIGTAQAEPVPAGVGGKLRHRVALSPTPLNPRSPRHTGGHMS